MARVVRSRIDDAACESALACTTSESFDLVDQERMLVRSTWREGLDGNAADFDSLEVMSCADGCAEEGCALDTCSPCDLDSSLTCDLGSFERSCDVFHE